MIPSLATTANSASTAPLGGHFWHLLEAAVSFVVAIGAVAIGEAIQKHRRTVARRTLDIAPPIPLFSDRPTLRAGNVATLERVQTHPATVSPLRPDPMIPRAALLPAVSLASMAAAAVHLAVIPEHFEESGLYGSFFLVLALAQIAYSIRLLMKPTTSFLVAGAASSLTIVALWVVTRTIGIPLGPAAGSTEEFGALDTLASAFEVIVAGGAIAVLVRRALPAPCLRPATWSRWIWVAAPAVMAAVAVTTVLSPPS